jgi:hypothetical protein
VELWTVRMSEKVIGRSTLLKEQEMTGETINDVYGNVGTGTRFGIRYFSAVLTTHQRES